MGSKPADPANAAAMSAIVCRPKWHVKCLVSFQEIQPHGSVSVYGDCFQLFAEDAFDCWSRGGFAMNELTQEAILAASVSHEEISRIRTQIPLNDQRYEIIDEAYLAAGWVLNRLKDFAAFHEKRDCESIAR
jgi:hypothetical protein